MKTIYESTFVSVGVCASQSLKDNFFITFGVGAPKDIADYCFIHRNEINEADGLSAGAVMTIGEQDYPVTSVGSKARENLRDLGHLAVRFDGAEQAEFPGTVHVAGCAPASIEPGRKFSLFRK
ncbi:PTS glucitol/sorbitol transporter subunit IIA [Rosenbergiella nectarea]|uniref:PTS glucitol/sorbitol transporter subunit IIA n=1 Tax=Rosenbergiella nectarea TaxID=988801 RepID=UPI001F4E9D4D|nr:PTS glucitol/sorbitol transporter subunit IIA [Rosenbergiella nectarea]